MILNILIITAFLVGYVFIANMLSSVITKLGDNKQVSLYRIQYVTRTLRISLAVVLFLVALLCLGIEYAQMSVFVSSIFAVIGVALFAQWSILSNITASLIIFFGFPYRVGDTVKILDGDNSIEGVIEDITLFHVLIKQAENMATYPNSLILQKPVVKLIEK